MKSNLEILTKLEIMQERKYELMRKEDKTLSERLYIIQLESNIKELEWCLDILQPMTDEEIKEMNLEQDRMSEFDYEWKEEPEENEIENTWETYN